MKRFLASVLIAALGVWTIGCENQKDTTENKTETTTTQTKDGKTTGETTHSVEHEDNEQPGCSRRWWCDDRNNDQKNHRHDHRDDQVVFATYRRLMTDGPGNGLHAEKAPGMNQESQLRKGECV